MNRLGRNLREPIAIALEEIQKYYDNMLDVKVTDVETYESNRDARAYRETVLYVLESGEPSDLGVPEHPYANVFTEAYYGEVPIETVVRQNTLFDKFEYGPALERYGLKIDKNNSDPSARCAYLYDASDFTPMQCQSDGTVNHGSWDNSFFIKQNYPAMYKSDGSLDYKLSKTNHAYREDNTTASDVSDTSYDGNALSVFDCHIWMKFYEDENYLYIEVSNKKLDDNFVDWPYILDNGSKSDKLFYPMFEGTVVDGKLRSIASGKATARFTAEDQLSRAQANDGLGNSSVWSIGDWSHHLWLTCLSMLVGKTTCPEMALGEGNTNGGSDASGFVTNGALLDKGAFWGKPRSSTAYENNQPVKLFFIENPYGNVGKRVLGFYADNGNYYIKTSPPYTVDSTHETYENCGALPGFYGYVKNVSVTSGGLLPSSLGGSGTTYMGAYYYRGYGSACGMLVVGGYCSGSTDNGFWRFSLDNPATQIYWNIGASLYLKCEKE